MSRKMTDDECPMRKECRSYVVAGIGDPGAASSSLKHLGFLRHSCFVIAVVIPCSSRR